MPLGRTQSVALVGLEGHVIDVEADVASGLPAFVLVGLPDTSLAESRDRVKAAAANRAVRSSRSTSSPALTSTGSRSPSPATIGWSRARTGATTTRTGP